MPWRPPGTVDEAQRARERAQLIAGAALLRLRLSERDAERLLTLLDELERWSRAYNLTAVRERPEMLTHHLLDSLAIHGDLEGTRIADVGTGAGFPGLPLALIAPARAFTLIDSNQKKLRFVDHVARVLGLANVTTAHARVERMRAGPPFDTVVARAFAPLPQLIEQVRGLMGPETRLLAMKGRLHPEELEAVPSGWQIREQRPLEVPGLGAVRHLVVLGSRER